MLDTYFPSPTPIDHQLAPVSATPAGKRTKIVCTLGPATDPDGVLETLIASGLDVARMNFSHGDHDDHARRYHAVRSAAARTGHTVATLADLQGPKIRLGRFHNGHALWMAGDQVTITTDTITGTADRVGTTYPGLARDAQPGDAILVDDGKLELRVEHVQGPDVICRVIHGGPVSDNKGLSLPDMNVSAPALSDKDTDDLQFALELGVDLIALSFVRHADDIDQVHEVMAAVGRQVPVIAKIEKPEAVENLEAIIDAFDGVMVARGDLGVETPLEDVPHVQKRAIQIAREKAKPVVVATQMLDSMIDNARPTRAEASDVANAVLDGADAVMLSGETSIGRHPVETVKTMVRIVAAAEQQPGRSTPFTHQPRTRSGVVSYAARDIAVALSARALVAFTQSGDTLRRLARLHPSTPLIALTPDPAVHNQLAMSWGATSAIVPPAATTDDMFTQVDEHLTREGICAAGDVVVVIAGSPPGTAGVTNLIRVHRVAESDLQPTLAIPS